MNLVMQMLEANRCIQCKTKPCVSACPVGIDIPGFIKQIQMGAFEKCISNYFK